VRKEPAIESELIHVLAFGETAACTGKSEEVSGKVRVELDAPIRGWVSLKLLGPLENSPEALAGA